jgi:hypothetical protein
MAMATVIWAAAAEAIIMDGAEDAAITTAGHEVIIVAITDTAAGEAPPVNSGAIGVAAATVQFHGSCTDRCFVPVGVSRCLRS